ncbi:sigma-70 family RNA polymerase sigma factor [Fodinicola acaciae]|uniref:sigma-70 family RNA polymerase sigma factor n=1 Tax=Fodinicola acaciae TaxID=2681555 RepID=UPI0013D104BA|nr:sigma-70 family RNA polymerase sigma factor [Fodinicola acaciae]
MTSFIGALPSGARPAVSPERDAWALVERVQAGDAEAFGLIYDRYVDEVYRFVAYRVTSRALAEDLTSETFVRALRRISALQWRGRDPGAWLITIARNLVADHYKSSRHRMEITTAEIPDGAPAVDGPERTVLDALTAAELVAAIRKLSAEQRECVTLRFLRCLSVEETAAAMGKNAGAVKALQYRAVRALARLLRDLA